MYAHAETETGMDEPVKLSRYFAQLFGKAGFACLFLLVMMVGLCSGCTAHSADHPSSSVASSVQTPKKSPQPQNNNYHQSTPSVRTYADSRWPTFNDTLLAIPEQNRWYNARNSVGTNCTIAGPVVNAYQATGSAGMPIFIDIGSAYPNPDSVTLLVWGDQYDEFAEMINAVDHGNAWLSVTGYLGMYDGYLQFDAGEGYIEYTWWTNVK